MIDSHTHPQFPQYDSDRDEMIRRSLDGEIQMICVGTDYEMSAKAVVLANQYEGICTHPQPLELDSWCQPSRE